jgi:hypothetical protein
LNYLSNHLPKRFLRFPDSILHKTFNASGKVVATPVSKSVHPTARRFSSESLSASNKPAPAPRATRVPAISEISGKVSFASLITFLLSKWNPFLSAVSQVMTILKFAANVSKDYNTDIINSGKNKVKHSLSTVAGINASANAGFSHSLISKVKNGYFPGNAIS